MTQSSPRHWIARLITYVLGLFILAMGVAVSINSNLGVSPVNSIPYVVSLITEQEIGLCVTGVFLLFILAQVAILRREFRPLQLLQIVFSALFGYFTNFTKGLLGDFTLPGYPGQLLMLAASILLIALGVSLYVEADLVPLPTEGLCLACAKKSGKLPFHSMKIILDCAMVATAAGLSLLFFHTLVGVREGTILTALIAGKVMAWLRPLLLPPVRHVCFGPEGPLDQESAQIEELEQLEGISKN